MHLAADPRNPLKSRNIYPRNDEAGEPCSAKCKRETEGRSDLPEKSERRRHRQWRVAIPYERFVAGLGLPRLPFSRSLCCQGAILRREASLKIEADICGLVRPNDCACRQQPAGDDMVARTAYRFDSHKFARCIAERGERAFPDRTAHHHLVDISGKPRDLQLTFSLVAPEPRHGIVSTQAPIRRPARNFAWSTESETASIRIGARYRRLANMAQSPIAETLGSHGVVASEIQQGSHSAGSQRSANRLKLSLVCEETGQSHQVM